jgi:chitinase
LRELLDAQGAKDGKSYKISIASTANYAYLQNYEWGNLGRDLDWINIMSYDFHGPFGGPLDTVTGHNSALLENPNEPEVSMAVADFNVEAAVSLFESYGVPRSKLNAGLAFYGRGYGNVPKGDNNGLFSSYSGASGKGTWERGSFDFWDLQQNYINKNGYTSHVDTLAGVPWLYSEQAQCFISYEDQNSIQLKSQYIQQEQLGGAMFWEFSGDKYGVLLDEVFTTLGAQ